MRYFGTLQVSPAQEPTPTPPVHLILTQPQELSLPPLLAASLMMIATIQAQL